MVTSITWAAGVPAGNGHSRCPSDTGHGNRDADLGRFDSFNHDCDQLDRAATRKLVPTIHHDLRCVGTGAETGYILPLPFGVDQC